MLLHSPLPTLPLTPGAGGSVIISSMATLDSWWFRIRLVKTRSCWELVGKNLPHSSEEASGTQALSLSFSLKYDIYDKISIVFLISGIRLECLFSLLFFNIRLEVLISENSTGVKRETTIPTSHYTQINLRKILNLNIRVKNLKLLEENTGDYFCDLGEAKTSYARLKKQKKYKSKKLMLVFKIKTYAHHKVPLWKWKSKFSMEKNIRIAHILKRICIWKTPTTQKTTQKTEDVCAIVFSGNMIMAPAIERHSNILLLHTKLISVYFIKARGFFSKTKMK